jgi:hypothetical protein
MKKLSSHSTSCGADPRSARVPPDPSIAKEISVVRTRKAEEGAGCHA